MLMRIIVALAVTLLAAPSAALAQDARLQLGHLDRLAELSQESVNVDIPAGLLKAVAAALTEGDEKQMVAKKFLTGLAGIHVRVFGFDRDNVYTPNDIALVRKQLSGRGWSRIVNVEKKQDRQLVEVHLWNEGGMTLLVTEARKLIVVNIVGPIDLSQLGLLQGQFGIPQLPVVDTADKPGR
jgi:hypothetical protein